MEKLLVRPSEAAEILGLGRSKVYAMLASGELPSVRIGKSVRVPTEALRQWVHARTITSSGEPSSESGRASISSSRM